MSFGMLLVVTIARTSEAFRLIVQGFLASVTCYSVQAVANDCQYLFHLLSVSKTTLHYLELSLLVSVSFFLEFDNCISTKHSSPF